MEQRTNSKTHLQGLDMSRSLTQYEEVWLNRVEKRLTCSRCDVTFANVDQLRFHQHGNNLCQPDLVVTCDMCDVTFSETHLLRFHQRFNSECRWAQERKRLLSEDKHGEGDNEYDEWPHFPSCAKCYDTFVDKHHLYYHYHLKPCHGKGDNEYDDWTHILSCVISKCYDKFLDKNQLYYHLKIHHRVCGCSECNLIS